MTVFMHIKVIGQGPDLVMLHGWSMNSAVWHDLATGLAQHFTLHLVDLPGHGQSDWQAGDLDLDRVVDTLSKQLPEQAYWLGWSLGGLISLAFADRFPARVSKLILLSATPCFVKNETWDCAMDATIFKVFADNLNDDQADTLQRFLLLQARGSKHSRDTIKQLNQQLAIDAPPKQVALQAGLDLLINTDLRSPLAILNCPVKMILGDRDTLIPMTMLAEALSVHPTLQTSILVGAGHAPFIAQAEQCQNEIVQFLND